MQELIELGKAIKWAVKNEIEFVRLSGCSTRVDKGDLEILQFLYREQKGKVE
jgi:hypothetical protein